MARRKSQATGPTFYTTFQVAKFLGVSPPTVVNWVKAKMLVAHRTPGGHRRIRHDDLVEFARKQSYPLPADIGGPAAAAGKPRVLVVDDEADFSAMVREYLQLRGGCEVEVADSGFTAGLTIARFRPHVVLMDILMPDMDGFEVLKMMQADPEMRGIPVIACTAYRDPAVEERVHREGFVAYLEKPLKFDKLLDVIDANVKRA